MLFEEAENGAGRAQGRLSEREHGTAPVRGAAPFSRTLARAGRDSGRLRVSPTHPE